MVIHVRDGGVKCEMLACELSSIVMFEKNCVGLDGLGFDGLEGAPLVGV